MARGKAARAIRPLFAWRELLSEGVSAGRGRRHGVLDGVLGREEQASPGSLKRRYPKNSPGRSATGADRPGVFVRRGLLLADERTVYVDVIQHDQAGPGFRSS